MSKPQSSEEGFTQIPNLLLEHLAPLLEPVPLAMQADKETGNA